MIRFQNNIHQILDIKASKNPYREKCIAPLLLVQQKNCMTKQCMQSNGEYNHTVTKFFM